jgi:hypothetical protein
MENSEKEAVPDKQYGMYVMGNYLITYDINMKIETYSCKDYSGIMFFTEDCRYDVCHNYLMGDRLIINPTAGGFRDIPFKPATFGFLPDNVTVKEIG